MTTTIEWTDFSWNPLRARRKDGTGKVGWACVRVSPGCVNCYAARQNKIAWAGGTGLDYTVPDLAKVDVYLDAKVLEQPLHWRKPRKVFVCSMTDLFGDWVTDSEIERVFGIMARARQHTFQVLTKRPDRMRAFFSDLPAAAVLPNVWLGTSVEDQQRADERIPRLLATPAEVRFLSCEPLLGPVDIYDYLDDGSDDPSEIQWVIVGGESGPRARPMDLAWMRSLVEQCRSADVPVFVKQLGATAYERLPLHDYRGAAAGTRDDELFMHESHGRDVAEWPEDLRIREWPAA